jgi:hypothetical protein
MRSNFPLMTSLRFMALAYTSDRPRRSEISAMTIGGSSPDRCLRETALCGAHREGGYIRPRMRLFEMCAAAGFLLAACENGGSAGSADASSDARTGSNTGRTDSSAEGSTPSSPLDCSTAAETTSVTGSVGGVSVGSTEAIGAYGKDSVTGVPYAGVLIWSRAGTCALVQSGVAMPPSTTVLMIQLASTDGSAPLTPGTYPYAASNGAPANGIALFVHFVATDSTCGQVLADGVGGVVNIEAVCGTTVVGSFDLHLSMGGDAGVDHVMGSFNAPVCNFDMNNFDPNVPPAGCPSMPDL